jgi:hypothetical protein
VTARRLNRAEYNNTIRDLLGVDLRPADDFPGDDSGYGFDNIGDVLTISPVLMEKYLAAAEKLARAAIVAEPPVFKPSLARYLAPRSADEPRDPNDPYVLPYDWRGGLTARHDFPARGSYELRFRVADARKGDFPPEPVTIYVDDVALDTAEIEANQYERGELGVRAKIPAGPHAVRVSFRDDYYEPRDPDPENRGRKLLVDYLDVKGPYDPVPPPLPASHKRIFVCDPASGAKPGECARTILARLAFQAYRRPVTEEEVSKLVRFVDLARQQGEPFERGIQVALQAILVSPHFLFRIERDPADAGREGVHRVNDHELASRLSYFLWSSMPDAELFRLAEAGILRQPEVLEAQARRMLGDLKSQALIDNFAGQWLELRNLPSATRDPERFPAFDQELLQAMRRETELFFADIMGADRSILDFLDGRYTYVNERLARHYGISGVEGEQFRRVALDGRQRSGVLTQASVLTVSSYPTRTSPVLRGLWLLENILGAPPPPPPAVVPALNEEAVGTAATLRERLEQHRADPSCAVCHERMDALGFALENYDAIGGWRTHDGALLIDASGVLPEGKSFNNAAELKAILRGQASEFTKNLAEKMLIYALGRGLEQYDRPVITQITRRMAEGDYRFSRLVIEIVKSAPFQMRRGEGGKQS